MLSLWCCVHDWYWWKGKFNCVKQWKCVSTELYLIQLANIGRHTFSVYQDYLTYFLSTWWIKIIWHTFSVVYQDAAQLPWVASRFLLPNCTYVVSNELPSFTTSTPYHTIPYHTIPYLTKPYHTKSNYTIHIVTNEHPSFLHCSYLRSPRWHWANQSDGGIGVGSIHCIWHPHDTHHLLPQIQTQPLVFIGTTSTSIQGVTQSNSWSPNFLNIHEYHDSFFAAMNSTHN